MDTSPLKAFATAARMQLLREVSARLSVVLAPSSIARVEALGAVSALERAIAGEGGGDIGQKAVIDQVAYMWFNRVIALRFMDANGYTGIGVVSPEKNLPSAQPEILTEAKLGQIDSGVLDAKLLARVSGLLNGTIRSEDSQNEAYGILLMGYCRRWNKWMPFMFEKEGDFTELLIPANLLSDESVIAKALKTLTQEVCTDVEVIGWLYQFYIADRKAEVLAGFKNNKKAGPAEIPAATQLFTPDWIVRYLVENSLGRLWLLNHPESKLAAQMQFYIPSIGIESEFLEINSPKELKVVDPACGSGHMLTYAFDLLYSIYEEEGYSPVEIPILILQNNLFGIEIDPRAGALAAFALAMKARARQRTFFTKEIAPNICILRSISFTPDELTELMTLDGHRLEEEDFLNQFEDADTFGSLIIPNEYVTTELEDHLSFIDVRTLHGQNLADRAKRVIEQAEYLSQRYNIVVANPPYLGSRNMGGGLSTWATRQFPDSKSDLFAMFVERGLKLTVHNGFVGMITMHTWMFLPSFERFREKLLKSETITSMAHLGAGAFGSIGGEVVATTAFVLKRAYEPDRVGIYLRLVDESTESTKRDRMREMLGSYVGSGRYHLASKSFRSLQETPLVYWLSEDARNAFKKGRPLGEVALPRQGLATGENVRFLRYWWEVDLRKTGFDLESIDIAHSSGKKWFPYNKGGALKKWYGNQQLVISFDKANYDILSKQGNHLPSRNLYFKSSVSWSQIGSGVPSFRYFPTGFIFDVTGMSAFCDSESQQLAMLGLLNSNVSALFLEALAPTLHFQVGDIARIPVPEKVSDAVLNGVHNLVEIAKNDWNSQEESWNFSGSIFVEKYRKYSNEAKLSLKNIQFELRADRAARIVVVRKLEEDNNAFFIKTFELEAELLPDVDVKRISLLANKDFRYQSTESEKERQSLLERDDVKDYIFYSVGCMFGRYSLDKPGLVLANQNETLNEYIDLVPNPSFMPDKDNVIPITESEWFEGDIIAHFRHFLRLTLGDEYFDENLRLIEESLGKDLRKYFITDFYKDQVQRYKKRPIYWLFSSEHGSFNALIYMHRYNPSTVSIVLNEYLREFDAKLRAELVNQERISAASTNPRDKARADKETDRVRKELLELSEYEHDVLYPLATQQITINLDDGVKVNYLKFGSALKSIPGLGDSYE